jgi:hypothetical protein
MSKLENKYYTPEISEFHVGFEYEEKSSGLWTPQIYNEFSPIINQEIINEHDDREDTIELYLKCEAVRVKYLDREDIESLGWVHEGTTVDDWYQLRFLERIDMALSNHGNRSFRMQHDFRTNQGVIITGYEFDDWSGDETTMYRGSCKNKSELKRLLKQLGI